MANEREIAVTIRAYDEFSAQMEKFKASIGETSDHAVKKAKEMESGLGRATDFLKEKWLELAGAYFSVEFLLEARREALEAETSLNKLRMQVENLGLSWEDQGRAVEDAISKTSEYAIVQEDMAARTLQQLIFNSGKYKESLENLNLVYDLAYQKGVDSSEAATLVGKALAGNVDMLGRYIPELHHVDDTLGSNATSAQKTAYALALLKEKTQDASERMTEHEKRAREAAKAMQEFKEAVGRVVLYIQDYALAGLDSLAAAFLYLAGYAAKAIAWLQELTARTDEAKRMAAETKAWGEAALQAADALGVQAGHLTGLTGSTEAHTKAVQEHGRASEDLKNKIKAGNDAKLEAIQIDQKRLLAIRAVTEEAKRSAQLETQVLEATFLDKKFFAKEYFNERMAIETKLYETQSSTIDKEIELNRKLARDKIANLDKDRATKKEIDAINLEMFNREFELTEKKKALDSTFTATALRNLMELKKAEDALFEERVAALGKLQELEQNSPYKPTPENFEGKNELVKAQETYRKKLQMLQAYNTQVIQEMVNAGATQDDINARYVELSVGYAKAERDLKIQYASDAFGAAANFMQNLYIATGSHNKSMFEAMKAFAIAQTIIDTYRAAQGAYAALSGIPYVGPALGTAAAIAAIVAGMARVAQIQSTHPGGGSISPGGTANPAYSGGSPSAYPVPQTVENQPQPSQNVTINIYNPLSDQNWQKIVEDNIVPALNTTGNKNIPININVVRN